MHLDRKCRQRLRGNELSIPFLFLTIFVSIWVAFLLKRERYYLSRRLFVWLQARFQSENENNGDL